MATKVSPLANTLQTTLVEVTSLVKAGIKAVTGSTGALYLVDVNNGDSNDVWVKLYDDTNPTMGTTDPDVILRIKANTREVHWIDGGPKYRLQARRKESGEPPLPYHLARLLTVLAFFRPAFSLSATFRSSGGTPYRWPPRR